MKFSSIKEKNDFYKKHNREQLNILKSIIPIQKKKEFTSEITCTCKNSIFCVQIKKSFKKNLKIKIDDTESCNEENYKSYFNNFKHTFKIDFNKNYTDLEELISIKNIVAYYKNRITDKEIVLNSIKVICSTLKITLDELCNHPSEIHELYNIIINLLIKYYHGYSNNKYISNSNFRLNELNSSTMLISYKCNYFLSIDRPNEIILNNISYENLLFKYKKIRSSDILDNAIFCNSIKMLLLEGSVDYDVAHLNSIKN